MRDCALIELYREDPTKGTRSRETRFTVHRYVFHLSFLAYSISYRPEVQLKLTIIYPQVATSRRTTLASLRSVLAARGPVGLRQAYDVVQYDGIRPASTP